MSNAWILDVIEDLRRFAEQNDLRQLSEQLEVAAETASLELARMQSSSAGNGWEAHAASFQSTQRETARQDS